ncbi:MAG: DUF6600 domain-containing protein, partial [Massilia sp.]
MTTRIKKTIAILVLSALSSLALADDAPTRVGRVSLTQGQVSIDDDEGEQATGALLNWPVTSQNRISTGRDGRAEFRVGSTSVRLGPDTALEIIQLDDDSLRLNLRYGSVNLRVRNAEVVDGFELTTPEGTLRLQQPGRFRIDAGRQANTSVVNVFDGVALLDGGGGARLIVRAGKRAELRGDEVFTGVAARDSFDDWSLQRDQRDENSISAQYVTSEMTGYEELDQNGVWRDDAEYGPLWIPRNVGYDWAPYRDGRWTYVSPWGWTWVDNAPWGYAPFHYGRWVQVNQRWAWAPGRNSGRPVWSPALVGWVGGTNWAVNFGTGGSRPAQGWYPLAPHDRYVPTYGMSRNHLDWVNKHAWNDNRGGVSPNYRQNGVTVVPNDHFGRRGTIEVRNEPKTVGRAINLVAAQLAPAAPSLPANGRRNNEQRN